MRLNLIIEIVQLFLDLPKLVLLFHGLLLNLFKELFLILVNFVQFALPSWSALRASPSSKGHEPVNVVHLVLILQMIVELLGLYVKQSFEEADLKKHLDHCPGLRRPLLGLYFSVGVTDKRDQ